MDIETDRAPQQVKRSRGRPKGIHTSIKLNPEVTEFLAEKIRANAIAQLQGVQTRTVKEFFKANDINPTLEELRSGLTEEFLKVVRKGLRLQNRWLDDRLNMDDETYLALPDSTKNQDARTAGLLTGINKAKPILSKEKQRSPSSIFTT